MSEDEKHKINGDEIQNVIAKHISESLDIPVYVINREMTEGLFEEIKKIPGIEKKYSDSELINEANNFISRLIIMGFENKEVIKEKVNEFIAFLNREKVYEATLFLPNIIGLPIGARIGNFEVVEQHTEDNVLTDFLEFQKKEKNMVLDSRSQAKVTFKAYVSNPIPTFYKILELPFAVLSLLLDFDLNPKDCVGIIKSPDISNIYFLEPLRTISGWTKYNGKYLDDHLNRLSEISLDNKPTRLQKKILQAFQVYGLSRLSQKAEIRFLFLISAFESLLLTENDRDYLGMKIAEKTAFLLENDYGKRFQLYKKMKSFYGKRSGIVHSGNSEISDSEVRNLESLFRATAFKLLELSKSYTKMEQKIRDNEQEGIEDLINKSKFS